MESLREHTSVKAYVQHGFMPTGDNDTQIWGLCPFCGKADKMYVNKENKAWDCKSCGKDGGYLKFLNRMAAHCREHFRGGQAIKLAKSRGVELATLRSFGMGYNPITENFTLPILTPEGNLYDLRIYRSSRLISTYGCRTGLLNWDAVEPCRGTVWLCEGEWDGMAMQEILTKAGRLDDVATAAPGAGTFKGEWIVLFKGKTVRVLYDNDEPGQKGAIKVYNNLKTVARDIQFINWHDTYPNHFDIRNLYKQLRNPRRVLDAIEAMLGDLPQNADVESVMSDGAGTREHYDGEGLTAEEVYEGYRRWLFIPDTSVIDVIYGTIIANRMPGDPLWLFLVAPSGMTKTEYLMSISLAKSMETVTTLTPSTLISGANLSTDPSLIPRLNGKILIIKDFTTILQMNQQARDEIFGILRDAYDGEISKMFGHGIYRHYRSKFGIIAGVTPAIEVYLEGESALGERFLRYRLELPARVSEQVSFLSRAMHNVSKEDVMRDNLRTVGTECLNYEFDTDVSVPSTIQSRILYLAVWTSMMRGTVVRDKYSKDVLHAPIREIGTRLSKQFIKLIMGMAAFHRLDEATEELYDTVKRLARGTVPSKLERIVRVVYQKGKDAHFTSKELAEIVGLPDVAADRAAENLCLLGVLTRHKLSSLKRDWRISEDALDVMQNCEVYG